MLLKSRKCSLARQTMEQIQKRTIASFITKDNRESSSILLDLFSILNSNYEILSAYADEASQVLLERGMITESMVGDYYSQLGVYGFAMSSLFLVYTPAKKEIKTEAGNVIQKATTDKVELHTSSYSLLSELASKGILEGSSKPIVLELSKYADRLMSPTNVLPAMKKGGHLVTVRLEPSMAGSNVKLVAKTPRSAINLKEVIIVPVNAVEMAMQTLSTYMSENLIEIGIEDKVRYVTKNMSILSSLYGEARASFLCKQPYNSLANAMYVPSVGASIYTAGVTNINIIMLDYVRKATLSEIDLSNINVNINLAPDYYYKAVKSLKKAQLVELATKLGVEDAEGKTVPELRQLCLESPKVRYSKDMYMTMKELPSVFNIDDFKNQKSKIGTLNDDVEIPSTVEDLKKLMYTGVFRVVRYDKSGKMKVMTVTSNPNELARIYGKNYVSNYEGTKVRCSKVRSLLEKVKGDVVPQRKLKLWKSSYKLDLPDDADYDKFTINELISSIEEASASRRTVVNNKDAYVQVRNCAIPATEPDKQKNFYKQLDLRSIVSITRLSSATVSESDAPKK